MLHRIAISIHALWQSSLVRLLLLVLLCVYVMSEAGQRNDLDIFLAASVEMFEGKNIYHNVYFDGYHYYYSTFFASLIRPLASLPAWLSHSLWLFLNIILLFRIWKIMFQFLRCNWLRDEWKTLLGFVVFLICLRFLRGNLHFGQMTILMLYMALESVRLISSKRWLWGGMLLAIAINFKVLPVVLIPYLFYRKEFRATVVTCLGVVMCFFIPCLWLGVDENIFLLAEWWQLVNPTLKRHLLDVDETSFHSLTTLLATLLLENVPDHYALPVKRNIADIPLESLKIVIAIVRMIFVFATLWFLRTWPFVRMKSMEKTWYELSYLLLIVPLIFPHQQHYAFLMCMPAIAIVCRWLMSPGTKAKYSWRYRWVLCATVVVFLVFNASIFAGQFNAWFNHFKILTYGAIILCIVLAAIPSTMNEKENARSLAGPM